MSASNTYVIIQNYSERYAQLFDEKVTDSQFFGDVSKIICFDDCSDDQVVEICFHGQLVHYIGWQPGMVYEFADTDGNIVWSGSFPQWDH